MLQVTTIDQRSKKKNEVDNSYEKGNFEPITECVNESVLCNLQIVSLAFYTSFMIYIQVTVATEFC